MRSYRLLTAALLCAAVVSIPQSAEATRYGLGNACTHGNLQDAIAAAGPNGVVFVRNSFHSLPGEITLPFNIRLEAADGDCRRDTRLNIRATLDAGSGFPGHRLFTLPAGVRLTLDRITLQNGRPQAPGGILLMLGGSQLGLQNSTLKQGTSTASGGCISAVGASISMIGDSSIRNCQARLDGGGVHMTGGILNLLGDTTIRDNQAFEGRGGNIRADSNARIVVHGTISGGEAERGGGVALVGRGGAVPRLSVLWDGAIRNNTAENSGGGINVSTTAGNGTPPEIHVSRSGSIRYNTAGNLGGGIYVDSNGAEITFSDSAELRENDAPNGGGIYASSSTIEFSDQAKIEDNDSETSGGAIYARSGSTVRLIGDSLESPVVVQRNDSQPGGAFGSGGGALYVDDSTVETMFADFYQNLGGATGGAILALSSEVKLENTRLRNNRATDGGGIAVKAGTLVVRSIFRSCTPSATPTDAVYCSLFSGNTALNTADGGRGGAILSWDGTRLDLRTTAFLGNYASLGTAYTGNGSAIALLGASYWDDSHGLLLNAVLRNNQAVGAYNATVWVQGGDLDVRNSTFVENARPIQWDENATGSFTCNVVQNNQYAIDWSDDVVTTDNLLGGSGMVLPAGANNQLGWASLTDIGHLQASSANAIDECATGPAFDILGTRRPQTNGGGSTRYDRGAVELD